MQKELKNMKNKLFPLLFVSTFTALLFLGGCTPKESFTLEKGVNIAHWLSQSHERGESRAAYFTSKDIEQIKAWGFDHVRIPIDEEQMFHEDGTKDEEAFALLHSAIDGCLSSGLRVIVDLHILRSHHFVADERPLFTKPEAQEAFYQCWRDLSDELRKYPVSMVAYELMNEPVADDPEDWNRIAGACYDVVRAKEKNRVIVIGSNLWQSFDTVELLSLPKGDPNIILSFHYYEPMQLTHYRASWTEMRDLEGPVYYPGEVQPGGEHYDKERFLREFGRPKAVAESLGIPVYCGEYGCLGVKANEEQRYRFFTDMNAAFDELGIARAVWCYREGPEGFGILSPEGTDTRMVEILTGK